MVFVACGLNHKTAPIQIREKLAIADEADQAQLLQQVIDHSGINEAAILSTCNRTEFYLCADQLDRFIPWFSARKKVAPEELKNYLYIHQHHDGVRHAMRVASGLDSMVVGEPQILGQMKTAYQLAERNGTIGKQLRPIFHHVFAASKRIRTQTKLGVNPVSVAYAGVHLINQTFKNLENLKVMLIGSGQTSQLVAKYLQKGGIDHFIVASRTLKNAKNLASDLNGDSITIGNIPNHIRDADIVISATACPLPFIGKGLIERTMRSRPQKSLFLLDLAVPRDIEPEVHEIENVYLYNIDDLQGIVEDGIHQRQTAASKAEQIIAQELEDYIRWHKSLASKDALIHYRNLAKVYTDKEVERALNRLQQGHANNEVIRELGSRLMHKLSHQPTVGLRRAAADGREDLLDLASYLFKD